LGESQPKGARVLAPRLNPPHAQKTMQSNLKSPDGLLETDQKLAGLDSTQKDIKKNSDGSVTVWFAPKAPAGQEANWVQTMPGKGWNTLLRLYGPLEPWFDKTWKPGDFERVD